MLELLYVGFKPLQHNVLQDLAQILELLQQKPLIVEIIFQLVDILT